MLSTLFVGIDVSQAEHVVCTMPGRHDAGSLARAKPSDRN